jgi:hypothetical protein
MRKYQCHSFHDLRNLARHGLPVPICIEVDSRAIAATYGKFLGVSSLGTAAVTDLHKAQRSRQAHPFLCKKNRTHEGNGRHWPGRGAAPMKDDLERDMRLMQAARLADLSRDNLRNH